MEGESSLKSFKLVATPTQGKEFVVILSASFWHKRVVYRSAIAMAQPSKKGPETTIKIFCTGCKQFLYKYKKVNYQGSQILYTQLANMEDHI